MKKIILCSFIFVGLVAWRAQGAMPPPAHGEMTRNIDNGIEWAKHLRVEAGKRSNMDSQHVDEEIKGIFDALAAMRTTADKIMLGSPGEKTEGHFTEMRRYQEEASAAANEFIAAKKEPKPNYSAMKKASNNILKNLEKAKHWHTLELVEIEHNIKD